MDKGVYCLIMANDACTINIGALGSVSFRRGWHVYVGSACGPGGLLRVRRHIRYSRNAGHPPRWHVDYLLSDPHFNPVTALCARSGNDMECRLASSLSAPLISRFGSSDCSCPSHLFYYYHYPEGDVARAFENLGLVVIIQNIKKL